MTLPPYKGLGVFIDPMTNQALRIYLDETHLGDKVYTILRRTVEDGGGLVTSDRDDAPIWIVDPDAPHVLGREKDGKTVLFAPWLLACVAYGGILGANDGDWCGFKVPLKKKKKNKKSRHSSAKQTAVLDVDRWPRQLKTSALRVPSVSLPLVEEIFVQEAPQPPPESEWGTQWSDGKRAWSAQEKIWIGEVIEWCLSNYPGLNLMAVCEVLGILGYHRSKDSYQYYVTRHLDWFADRSSHLSDLLLLFQSEHQAEIDSHNPTPAAPKPGWYYESASSEGEESSQKISPPFTEKDRDNFIQFAVSRPDGMEPVAGEAAADVWKVLAKIHPEHTEKGWRMWHSRRRAELKAEIDAYRASMLS